MKFKVGQIWEDGNGYQLKITSINDSSLEKYPVVAIYLDDQDEETFTENGNVLHGNTGSADLKQLITEKQKLNFWEARQAALEGKKVRIIDDPGLRTIYDKYSFKNLIWGSGEFEAKWEIVEEPQTTTSYLNVYPFSHGTAWHSKSEADKSAGRVGVLEIITDENGKLISAKNV